MGEERRGERATLFKGAYVVCAVVLLCRAGLQRVEIAHIVPAAVAILCREGKVQALGALQASGEALIEAGNLQCTDIINLAARRVDVVGHAAISGP